MTPNTQATHQPELFHGLAAHRFTLPNGDTLLVAEQGAQVLSWVSAGRERLYLSQGNVLDGRTAIRGGVPVCFPQFNQRGTGPKHGFVRNLAWALQDVHFGEPDHAGQVVEATFALRDDARTTLWPHSFALQLQLHLSAQALRITLHAHNTSTQDWAFTGALHTYLAVDDVTAISLHGLGGQAEWDAMQDSHGVAAHALTMRTEFDRVYQAAQSPLVLQDGQHRLQISQSPDWPETVVWNPGPDKHLPDMPAGDHARMLCVEAARVFEPVCVSAGQSWQGWQMLKVLS